MRLKLSQLKRIIREEVEAAGEGADKFYGEFRRALGDLDLEGVRNVVLDMHRAGVPDEDIHMTLGRAAVEVGMNERTELAWDEFVAMHLAHANRSAR